MNLQGTIENFQKNVKNYKSAIKNMDVGDVANRTDLMEYHYQQVIHYLQQIDYHMDQIAKHSAGILDSEVPPSPSMRKSSSLKTVSSSGVVRTKVDHYNSLLSSSYFAKQMKDIDEIFEEKAPKMSKCRQYHSMENMLNSELAPMPIKNNGYQVTRRKSIASHTKPNISHTSKPKIISVVMKSPQ